MDRLIDGRSGGWIDREGCSEMMLHELSQASYYTMFLFVVNVLWLVMSRVEWSRRPIITSNA